MKITLQDIIDQVVEQTGITKKLSEDFLREFLVIIQEALNKDAIVKVKGLGTFKLLSVEERKSINVQTGEEIIIPSHNKVSFAPEKELKAAVNKPFAHLETYILSGEGPVDDVSEDEEDENETLIMEGEVIQPEVVEEKVESTLEFTVKEDVQPEITKTEDVRPEIVETENIQPEMIENEEEPLSEVTEQEQFEPEMDVQSEIAANKEELSSEKTEQEQFEPEINIQSEIIKSEDETLSEETVQEEPEIENSRSQIEEGKDFPEIESLIVEEGESCGRTKKCKLIIFFIIFGLIALLIWLWCSDYPKMLLPADEVEKKTETVQPDTIEDEVGEVVSEFDEVDDVYEVYDVDETDTIDIAQLSQMEIMDDSAEHAYVAGESETDSTTPNPNRKPEFEGEYMFDARFDFKLLDFMQANYPKMKLITYGTPREVELKRGDRLTLVSLKYYGHKQYWVYIYFYNTDVIKNPDNVPAGITIKVPRLDKTLVNPNNQATIDAAREVQVTLLKM